MSLDIHLRAHVYTDVAQLYITHNLSRMARKAGLYECLWTPEKLGLTKAGQLIDRLVHGLAHLKAQPDYFRQFNAANGWGKYEDFVGFVEDVLEACQKYPEADLEASR